MTGKKFFSGLLVVSGLSCPVCSFAWNPTLSVLGNYTLTNNTDVPKSGSFSVQNRKMNLGLEFTSKFHLGNDYFIRTGVRYSSFNTTISAVNHVPALIEVPYQLGWAVSYASFTVPIHFGRDFVTGNGRRGDYYAGVSVGILTPWGATEGMSSGASQNGPDTLTTKSADDFTNLPSFFLATADFGASYQPFKNNRRFTMGLLCSIQLTNTTPYTYGATVNDSHGKIATYEIQHREQFTNCAVSLSYTFGKLKALSQGMLPLSN
jgi:hypothetical protein